jgi:hypothetical protein
MASIEPYCAKYEASGGAAGGSKGNNNGGYGGSNNGITAAGKSNYGHDVLALFCQTINKLSFYMMWFSVDWRAIVAPPPNAIATV